MARARSSSPSNLLSDLANCSFLMQKRIVAFPLQPNHDAQVASMGNVQKPAWRGCVRADGIHAVCRHQREILFHHSRRRECAALYARPKCPVGYARTKSFSWPAHRNLPPKTTREPSQTVFEGETRSRTSSGSETGTSAGALIGIILTDISALHLN